MIPHILSVNIARPGSLEVRGRSIPTGIFKEPTEQSERVESLGLVRDFRIEPRKYGESNHAVHAYPHEHYGFWERELGRAPFPFGHFGENLTIAGLLEADVHIGDVFRFGSCVLQVTQPRIPCRKLNARMGESIAIDFLRTRRTGYYFRVLEAGEVRAQDAIELLDRDEASPSVDEFIRISQFDYWDAEALEYVMRARALPEEWLATLQVKLQRAREAKGWFGLRELEIVSRKEERSGVVSLELRCAAGRLLPGFEGGQYLNLVVKPSKSRPAARRCYAISSSPFEGSSYRITIQRHISDELPPSEAPIASILHGLEVGDRVRAEAPNGLFTFGQLGPECDSLLFIERGIGVSPVLGLLHQWSWDHATLPAIVAHQDLSGSTHVFREDLLALAAAHENLRLFFAYEEPEAGERLGVDFHLHGELEWESLRSLMPGAKGEFFVSGASPFVDRIDGLLRHQGGIHPSRIHKQRFGK
ncbi:MAG: MOSC domain-containing protein [Myxococcales bacterium]|nr:MOSC domain-containing protein [Myxococcales bacterium]